MNDEDVAPGSVPPLKYMQDRHKKIWCFGKSLFGASLKKGKGKKRGDVDEDALSDQERVLLLYYA